MRHDPINVPADGSAPSRGGARRARRPATRRPTPIDVGVPVAATEDQGQALAVEVLDPERSLPIVCLSTRTGEDRPALDPHAIRKAVGRDILLRAVRTGPASRFLSALLPPQLGVFGGAARIWWPGLDGDADPRDHPLVLDRVGRYGPRALEVLAERFAEGPPAPGARRPGPGRADPGRADHPSPGRADRPARLVALPGGADDAVAPPPLQPPAAPAPPSAVDAAEDDRRLLLGALDGARDEIRALREKLAAARLDAMTPGARQPASSDPGHSTARRGLGDVRPRAATADQVATLAIPAAVARDRERAHHLEIVAAWLVRDHDAGRRDRPLGPLAIGDGYLDAIERLRYRVGPATLAIVAARIASGKQGEADDLDVRAEVGPSGAQEQRAEDGAPCWSCAIPEAGGLRLRWWTRDDGAVELRDVV